MSYNEMYLIALSGIALLSISGIIFTISKSTKSSLRLNKDDKNR